MRISDQDDMNINETARMILLGIRITRREAQGKSTERLERRADRIIDRAAEREADREEKRALDRAARKHRR